MWEVTTRETKPKREELSIAAKMIGNDLSIELRLSSDIVARAGWNYGDRIAVGRGAGSDSGVIALYRDSERGFALRSKNPRHKYITGPKWAYIKFKANKWGVKDEHREWLHVKGVNVVEVPALVEGDLVITGTIPPIFSFPVGRVICA